MLSGVMGFAWLFCPGIQLSPTAPGVSFGFTVKDGR